MLTPSRMLAAILLAIMVAACAGRGDPVGQTTIDGRFLRTGFMWNTGALVYVFVGAQPHSGKVAICAAYMPAGGSPRTRGWNKDLLSAAVVKIGGKRVMQSLGYANELPEMDDVRGQPARCAVTSATWHADYERENPEVEFPRMQFID